MTLRWPNTPVFQGSLGQPGRAVSQQMIFLIVSWAGHRGSRAAGRKKKEQICGCRWKEGRIGARCCCNAVNPWPPGCPGFVDFIGMMWHDPEDFRQKTEVFLFISYFFSEPLIVFTTTEKLIRSMQQKLLQCVKSGGASLQNCKTATSRRCFCREAWSQWSRLGIWSMTAKGKAHCLLLPSLDPKPWWERKDLLQQPRLGKECCGVSPWQDNDISVHWNGLDTIKSMQDTMTVFQHEGISGGVAHAAACLKALYLWVPEHRLYGVFLLVKKDTMFV